MHPAFTRAVTVTATTLAAGWRRRGVVVISGLVAAGIGFSAAGQVTPTYRGTAAVLVGPPPGSSTTTGKAVAVTPAQVADAAAVLVSPSLSADAAKLAGVAALPRAHASTGGANDVVTVSVDAHTAKAAARWALAYADAYVADQQATAIGSLEQTASTLSARIGALDAQIAGLDARIAAAGGPTTTSTTLAPPTTYPGVGAYGGFSTLPGFGGAGPFGAYGSYGAAGTARATPTTLATPPPSTGNPTVDGLLAQRSALRDQQALLAQQASAAQLEAAAFSGGGQVVSGGTPPTSPVHPRVAVWAVAAGLLGAAIATSVVTTLDWRRRGPIVLTWQGRGRRRGDSASPGDDDAEAVAETVRPPSAPAPAPAAAAPAPAAAPAAAPAPAPAPAAAPAAANGHQPPRTVVLRLGAPAGGAAAGRLRFVPRPPATAPATAPAARPSDGAGPPG